MNSENSFSALKTLDQRSYNSSTRLINSEWRKVGYLAAEDTEDLASDIQKYVYLASTFPVLKK